MIFKNEDNLANNLKFIDTCTSDLLTLSPHTTHCGKKNTYLHILQVDSLTVRHKGLEAFGP